MSPRDTHTINNFEAWDFVLGVGLASCSAEGTQEISQNQGSELSNATTVPQSDAVAEDKLILMPGNAVGIATPLGIPVCYWSTRNTEG